jgi:hypothetical protein
MLMIPAKIGNFETTDHTAAVNRSVAGSERQTTDQGFKK